MNYIIRTNHQDGRDYVCNTTTDIVPALNYATEMTRNGYPYPLIIENEMHDEICIVFNGCLYQEGTFRDICEYATEIEEDYK